MIGFALFYFFFFKKPNMSMFRSMLHIFAFLQKHYARVFAAAAFVVVRVLSARLFA